MGRKRKVKLNELNERIMKCKCGRKVKVFDVSVVAVSCVFCATKTTPLSSLTPKQLEKYDQEEQKRLEKSMEPTLTKSGKRRGRPRKHPLPSATPVKVSGTIPNQPKISTPTKDNSKVGKESSVKSKTSKPKVVKKGNTTMDTNSETPVTKVKGKRGRKATVGAKILSFLNEQPGAVKFEDIFKVYTEERARLGKLTEDSVVEERNCRSTLYVMSHSGKIKEVVKKEMYSSL